MTLKINVIMLRKNRCVERFKISPDQNCFDRRGNLYMVPKEAINSIGYADKANNPHAELIYVEENPIPFSLHTVDKSSTFLEDMVIQNVLESTGEPRGFFLEIIGDYLKTPAKLIMLAFAGVIIYSLATGLIHA
jgi:hypothetical protein